ncbi:MAG: LysR family hydrogen peroxide-inducible transcriptional activator [Crocinitomicaceae bacterium]|jgi:LysR family hydrogen peroxide-inducible transcriptional activator
MISIQQMQYIVTVAEERQFQRASERCFVTQPTLSMQIKKAEQTLGNQIFDRSRSPLELTEYGKELLVIIRDVLTEYSRVKLLGEQRTGSYREQLKVGIIPTIAGYMLPGMFDEWMKDLEGVELIIEEMKTEEILVALEEKTIDLGILAGPVHQPKWRTTVLFHEEIYAYAPMIKEKTISPQKLEEYHPWLLSKGNCLRTQMIHFCELEEKSKLGWNYEGGNIELLVKMVDLHDGYTLIPSNYKGLLNLKNVVRIQSDELKEYPAREIIAVSSNRNPKWSSLEKLIRLVQLKYFKAGEEGLKLLSWK